MDIATLIGILAGFALIVGSMLLGGTLAAFFNAPSLLIVVGGTLAATLINESLSHVLGAVKVCARAFFDRERTPETLIAQIVDLAGQARKHGLMVLEGVVIEDEFLERGVRLGVDGLSPELVTTTLTSELLALKQRHQRGQQIFRFMGTTAPAMGMVGTLIGLVQMLRQMDNPDQIGPAMSVALLTTLYGAVLAFMVFNPIASKLEVRSAEEMAQKRLIVVGVESILKGDSTLVIQSKLDSFLSPLERRRSEVRG